MSQTLTPKNVANRRSFLALAVAAAAIVPISESALARDRHDHSKTALRDLTHRRMLPVIKRRFKPQWLFEIFGSVTFSGCGTFRSQRSTRTIRRSRPRNSKQLQTRKLSPRQLNRFMARAAKDSFFKLLAGHYGAVKAYLVATVAGDVPAQAKATQSLTSNAEEIATFLSQSKSLFAERRSARPSSGAWRPSHPTNPAIEGSQIRGRGPDLGGNEEACLSNSRRDGGRPG